jgi:hypothetical protein
VTQEKPKFSVGERTGKYYGTHVMFGKISLGRIWNHGSLSTPSKRELEYLGGGRMTESEFWEECCDSHWESQQNLDEATELVNRLNEQLMD